MNENIDLTKILKDCPKGWKFYSSVFGNIEFEETSSNTIIFKVRSIEPTSLKVSSTFISIFSNGKYTTIDKAGCIVFPSKEQRDWSKFTAPWYKKEKFDPKTLNPFDKVLVYDTDGKWRCNLFSHIRDNSNMFPYATIGVNYSRCIPYNDETKHLVDTTEEAPEYYRYWKD